MKVAINQPTYFPWIGYLDLVDQVDCFVILDNVQFVKQSWQHRNRIRTAAGLQWLTVPVKWHGRFGQLIQDVEIRDSQFGVSHLRAIELAYRRSQFFNRYFPELSNRLLSGGSSLVEMNVSVLTWMLETLGIGTPLVTASSLGKSGKRTDLLAEICSELRATQYISPAGSAEYLIPEQHILSERGIQIGFQHYEHPTYRQLHQPFTAFASAVDLIFNEGNESLRVLRSGRRPCYSLKEMSDRQAATAVVPGL